MCRTIRPIGTLSILLIKTSATNDSSSCRQLCWVIGQNVYKHLQILTKNDKCSFKWAQAAVLKDVTCCLDDCHSRTEPKQPRKKNRWQRLFLHSSLFITVIYGNIFPWSSAIFIDRDNYTTPCLKQINPSPILHSVRCIKINNHSSSIGFHTQGEIHIMIAFIIHSHRPGTFHFIEWIILHHWCSFELQLEKLHWSKTQLSPSPLTCKRTLWNKNWS